MLHLGALLPGMGATQGSLHSPCYDSADRKFKSPHNIFIGLFARLDKPKKLLEYARRANLRTVETRGKDTRQTVVVSRQQAHVCGEGGGDDQIILGD